jgi:hypothetical protein
MNKKIISVILLVILFLYLCGCTSNQNNENNTKNLDENIFGTWQFRHDVIEQNYTFFENGTFLFNDIPMGEYTANNGELIFIYEDGISITLSYFFNNSQTLDITDEFGATMTYTKQ